MGREHYRFIVYLIGFLWGISVAPLMIRASASPEKIPDCLLNYRYGPEQFIIIVEKVSQNLYVYSNYSSQPVNTYRITTGRNHGRKLEEGDMRTPEGIYFFRRIVTGDELPKTDDYGEKAFTLNYPNPIDQREKRNGSGIWLHGAFDDNKISNPNNTRGCVVMRNADLVDVSKYIYINKTPICIYNKIKYDTVENIEKRRERFIDQIKNWKNYWEKKDIEGYIEYYDPWFTSDGMGLAEFKNYKNRLNKRYKYIRVFLSDISVYAFNEYFLVMYNQLYISDVNDFYSQKIQYWHDMGTKARITSEEGWRLPALEKFEITRGNYITINEFRRDLIDNLKEHSTTVTPHMIYLQNISIMEETVNLELTIPAKLEDIKVIPVLRFENGDNHGYHSLAGINLKDGVPQDFSGAVPLRGNKTSIAVRKEKGDHLISLTLFVLNRQNRYEQIITYYVNQ